jgi:hypothetical protein
MLFVKEDQRTAEPQNIAMGDGNRTQTEIPFRPIHEKGVFVNNTGMEPTTVSLRRI